MPSCHPNVPLFCSQVIVGPSLVWGTVGWNALLYCGVRNGDRDQHGRQGMWRCVPVGMHVPLYHWVQRAAFCVAAAMVGHLLDGLNILAPRCCTSVP